MTEKRRMIARNFHAFRGEKGEVNLKGRDLKPSGTSQKEGSRRRKLTRRKRFRLVIVGLRGSNLGGSLQGGGSESRKKKDSRKKKGGIYAHRV